MRMREPLLGVAPLYHPPEEEFERRGAAVGGDRHRHRA